MAESTDEASHSSDDENTLLEGSLAVVPPLELDLELELPMPPPSPLLKTDIHPKKAAKRSSRASTRVGYRGYVACSRLHPQNGL
jgi:hypothetical protein